MIFFQTLVDLMWLFVTLLITSFGKYNCNCYTRNQSNVRNSQSITHATKFSHRFIAKVWNEVLILRWWWSVNRVLENQLWSILCFCRICTMIGKCHRWMSGSKRRWISKKQPWKLKKKASNWDSRLWTLPDLEII